MSNTKICLITNLGAHYRYPIFEILGRELHVEFYLGDKVQTPIKTFNYEWLTGYRKTLKNVYLGNLFYWQKGSVKLIYKPYHFFITDGEPYNLSTWVLLILAKLLGKKTIAWTHGWYGREGFLKKWLKKWFYSLHSHLLVYNNYAIGLMREVGISEEKMTCIANSLDSDSLRIIRQSLHSTSIYSSHFNNTNPTVLYCGRIQKRKHLHLIIDAALRLQEENKLVNIVFVGEDVDDVKLDSYAKQHQFSNCWMYGPCYDEHKLGELFYNAAVCISPGNVGLTAIHALSYGCPVITHDNFSQQMPEFEAVVPGKTGSFFKQNSPDDLVKTMIQWIGCSESKRQQTRLSAFNEIDSKWNVHYQLDVIKKVIYDR